MSEERKPSEIMQYFTYKHLSSPELRVVSQAFAEIAREMDEELPPGAEKAVCLRKLLEAKDAAVRSALGLVQQNV